MTPKNKAEELFNKMFCSSRSIEVEQAKKCALIAVDELIYETQFEVPNIRQRYWINVKHEINKL